MSKINVLEMIEELRFRTISKFEEGHIFGDLLIIQVDYNPASDLYIKSKQKELSKWGINVVVKRLYKLEARRRYGDVYAERILLEISHYITRFNKDKNCIGIIIQLPLPDYMKTYEEGLIRLINYNLDVDGFKKDSPYTACTPKGIMYILNKCRDIKGKTVCMIGRGKTVGEPLIDILSKEPCTLLCCNSNTSKSQLAKCVGMSDIVITAVGKPGLLRSDMLKTGALVIDAGISYVDGKQTGDYIHDESRTDIDYTPHLGGVGKMTVAMLAMNCIKGEK